MSNRSDHARRVMASHRSTAFPAGGAIAGYLPEHTASERAKPAPVPNLPAKAIDLAQGFSWTARNQLDRNNCIAFATVACFELAQALAARPRATQPARLSAGFLYATIRQHPPHVLPEGWDAGGAKFIDAYHAFTRFGLCPVDACPDDVPPLWPLSPAALRAARQNIPAGLHPPVSHKPGGPSQGPDGAEIFRKINTLLLDELSKNRPVGVSFPMFSSGQYSTNWEDCGQSDGTLHFPDNPDFDEHIGGHAVCVTGFQPSKDKGTEGGYFIFRDSAGVSFPRHRILGSTGDGYGRVSLRDMRLHCWDVLLLRPLNEKLP